MRTLLYVTGEPGSGKSTLLRELTAHLTRGPLPGNPGRDGLWDRGDLVAVELGRRRADFSGTDALAMNAITASVEWLPAAEAPLVLGEGARLANRRFLAAAVAAGYATHLLLLEHDRAPEWRGARARRLGTAQSDSWVKGRRTAALNLAADPGPGVTVHRGDPPELEDTARALMDAVTREHAGAHRG